MSALFLNKIGDWGLIGALILAMAIFSDLSLGTIFSLASQMNGDLLFILLICFIIAAAAKSALLGLHVWLSFAMEGKLFFLQGAQPGQFFIGYWPLLIFIYMLEFFTLGN
jgi:formate hydrogenlyase subunit 3/multisubunit Na+/H+ antiporter MnhD subunit